MQQSYLADFLRRKMEDGNLSTYEIARRSGGRINANTITRIVNGDIKEARLSTLEAIAVALEMSVEDVVRIERGLPERPSRFEMYAETFSGQDLTEEDWRVLEIYFKSQVDQWIALKSAAAKTDKSTTAKRRENK